MKDCGRCGGTGQARPPGRPPLGEKMTTLQVRVTVEQKERWKRKAEEAGVSLSDWSRGKLDAE